MWAAILTLAVTAGQGPVPDANWVVTLAPSLAACERRGTSALTTWACPDLNFAICHQGCADAVVAIEAATSRRYQTSAQERTNRRLPVGPNYAVVNRTTWIVGPGSVAASLDVMHRDRDALVCGVSPMNPVGESGCDALLSRLVEADLTGPPAPAPKAKERPLELPAPLPPTKGTKSSTKEPEDQEKQKAEKTLSDGRRMAFAIQAYAAADYSRAGALALQIISSPKATSRQRREALMMTGAIHRLEGRDNQARASFMQVLEDDPKANLPRVYPKSVRRFFAMVQEQVRAEGPKGKAPSTRALGLRVPSGCRAGQSGQSRTITCENAQLSWRVHQSATEASKTLQDALMAYRAYTGIDVEKHFVECMIQKRASRCIDMKVQASTGDQHALLGYAEVRGKILSVSCRWAGGAGREPPTCRGLISKR